MTVKTYKTIDGLARGVAAALKRAGIPQHKRGQIQTTGYAVGAGFTLVRVYHYSFRSKPEPPTHTLDEVCQYLQEQGFNAKIQSMPEIRSGKMKSEIVVNL